MPDHYFGKGKRDSGPHCSSHPGLRSAISCVRTALTDRFVIAHLRVSEQFDPARGEWEIDNRCLQAM
jgi:hypothetical protein